MQKLLDTYYSDTAHDLVELSNKVGSLNIIYIFSTVFIFCVVTLVCTNVLTRYLKRKEKELVIVTNAPYLAVFAFALLVLLVTAYASDGINIKPYVIVAVIFGCIIIALDVYTKDMISTIFYFVLVVPTPLVMYAVVYGDFASELEDGKELFIQVHDKVEYTLLQDVTEVTGVLQTDLSNFTEVNRVYETNLVIDNVHKPDVTLLVVSNNTLKRGTLYQLPKYTISDTTHYLPYLNGKPYTNSDGRVLSNDAIPVRTKPLGMVTYQYPVNLIGYIYNK